MNVWTETYGADIDGNRGVPTTFAELEDSDNDAVVDALYPTFVDGKLDGVVEIEIEGHSFDVSIEDYTEELIAKGKEDYGFKQDADFKKMILDIEMDYLVEKAEKINTRSKV